MLAGWLWCPRTPARSNSFAYLTGPRERTKAALTGHVAALKISNSEESRVFRQKAAQGACAASMGQACTCAHPCTEGTAAHRLHVMV